MPPYALSRAAWRACVWGLLVAFSTPGVIRPTAARCRHRTPSDSPHDPDRHTVRPRLPGQGLGRLAVAPPSPLVHTGLAVVPLCAHPLASRQARVRARLPDQGWPQDGQGAGQHAGPAGAGTAVRLRRRAAVLHEGDHLRVGARGTAASPYGDAGSREEARARRGCRRQLLVLVLVMLWCRVVTAIRSPTVGRLKCRHLQQAASGTQADRGCSYTPPN